MLLGLGVWGLTLLVVGLVVFHRGIKSWLDRKYRVVHFDGEQSFLDPLSNRRRPFPSLFDDPTVHLSVVVPAYNEEDRLSSMLDETFQYLEHEARSRKSFSYEVIVVDDGSRDDTVKIAYKYVVQKGVEKMRVLKLHHNQGKGAAVRKGVLASRGSYILMVDADGATRFSDVRMLETKSQRVERNHLVVGVGSRAHLQKKAIAKRTLFRNFLMHGFHFAVWLLCVRGVQDTQCGFKLFSRRAAQMIFPNLHIERWCFDVEVLFLAQRMRIPIKEVSVHWVEIAGSKLKMWSAAMMGKDLLMIRGLYMLGLWTYSRSKRL